MCIVVYIASEIPLPTITSTGPVPAFHVIPLESNDSAVRARFSKPHVYYVGSHEGCGCGFAYGLWEGEPEAKAAASKYSVDRLADYLTVATRSAGNIELYACWDGDQNLEPLHRIELTPASFGGASFAFEERTFALITMSNRGDR